MGKPPQEKHFPCQKNPCRQTVRTFSTSRRFDAARSATFAVKEAIAAAKRAADEDSAASAASAATTILPFILDHHGCVFESMTKEYQLSLNAGIFLEDLKTTCSISLKKLHNDGANAHKFIRLSIGGEWLWATEREENSAAVCERPNRDTFLHALCQ